MTQSRGSVLAGGLVIDGTGSQGKPGDVAVRDGRIASVEEPSAAGRPGYKIVDCRGFAVAPGFIDAHSHSDLQTIQNRTEKLLQGVTAEVVGNCGFSAYPLPAQPEMLREFANGILCGEGAWGWESAAGYLESAGKSKTATVASLVGHGSLRIKVAGNAARVLTQREMDRMAGLLAEMLDEGAAGFSSGLMYAPGSSASPDELIMLARVAARKGKVYATHMRSYSAGLVEAVKEQLRIAEASGCRLQISHLQAAGEEYWPLQQQAVELIEEASGRGTDVAFDVYPWLAGSTVLTQVLPQEALEGGEPRMLDRLRDPVQREWIRAKIKPEARWPRVVIISAGANEERLVGRSIAEIADERGADPENAVMDLLLEQEGRVNVVEHCLSPDNLHALLTHPLAMVVTDGVYSTGRSHPRLYGTFPLLLGEMVRKRGWLRLEEAIHKVTAMPAERFHLKDRGRIVAGCVADLVIFDPETVATEATYEAPDVAPTGIKAVLRNGQVIVNSAVAA